MYESYEALMERKLAMTQDKRDRRQGSVIFDAMAPNAAETAAFYADLTMLEDRTFADTATGEDLTRRCMERGIFRKEAIKATFYGTFTDTEGEPYEIEADTRFYMEPYYYRVLFQEEDGRYVLECETPGEDGNSYLGALLPLEHLEGLAEATLSELRTDGEDEESDEMLRKRYMESFSADAFGGNVADYKQKVSALQNVGGVKIYPVWNGGGTVKVVIIEQGWKTPTSVELQALQEEIDPQQRGEGYGLAPIGHRVTVAGVTEKICQISMEITWKTDADAERGKAEIQEKIAQYFLQLRQAWAESEHLIVRISYLESAALSAADVLDVQNCTINETAANLQLGADEIPVLGEIEVAV